MLLMTSILQSLIDLDTSLFLTVNGKIDLDEAAAAAVADGGYVGLYLWDGMLPYIDAIEIQ